MDLRKFSKSALILWLLILGSSCTKVIKVDLNSASPNIVVDAEVTDQAGPYTFNLTKTVNFSDDNVFPALSGAAVVLSDNAGNSETLTEINPGNYVTSHIQGIIGRTYNLSITANGKNYTATSTMPAGVPLDSVVADTTSPHRSFGFGGNNSSTTTSTAVTIRAVFTDPKGVANYYRLIEFVNGVGNYSSINVISDQGQDGALITETVVRRDTSLHAGDLVNIVLESIDVNVYEYFRTFKQVTRAQTGIQVTVPGNPTTNLSNNALGFFSAHALRSMYVIVP